MPQAATLPTPAHTPRRTRETQRSAHAHNTAGRGSLEARTAVLETRWEETVPTLATKADISDLRSELLKWGVGAGIALAAVFFGLLAASTARTDAALAEVKADVRETHARMDKLDTKLEQSVARLDARMDRLDAKLDTILSELRAARRSAQ